MIDIGLAPILQTTTPDFMPGICAGSLCLVGILPFIIWIIIGIWMYKDAKKRDENAVLWLIVGLVAGLIGLIIWFVVRPSMDEVRRNRQQQQQQYQQPPPGQQPPPQ